MTWIIRMFQFNQIFWGYLSTDDHHNLLLYNKVIRSNNCNTFIEFSREIWNIFWANERKMIVFALFMWNGATHTGVSAVFHVLNQFSSSVMCLKPSPCHRISVHYAKNGISKCESYFIWRFLHILSKIIRWNKYISREKHGK